MVTISAVWDRTTEFLSDNAGAVIGIAALTIFLPGIAESVLTPLQAAAEPGGLKVVLSIVALAIALLNLFGQLALTALALDPALGQRGAFGTAAARFLPMIGVSIALLILALLVVLPPIVALAAGGVDFETMRPGWTESLSPATIWFVSLYSLALIPFMVWATARLSLVLAVVAGERLGLGALRRSWALTRGSVLRIIGACVLLLVVGGVAILATQTVFGSVFRLVLGDSGQINLAMILTAVFVSLVSTALAVILTAFLAKLYLALRGRVEAAVPA